MTKAKKLRVADLARAIDKPESSIRTWLKREQVTLPGLSKAGWLERAPRDGWREFKWTDIATLAVISKLVDYGWHVETASTVAENLQNLRPKAFGTEWNNPLSIIAECSDLMAILVHDGIRSYMGLTQRDKFSLNELVDSKGNPLTDFLVLDLGELVASAFRKADPEGHGSESESN